jgi:hypothetical protein
VPQQAALAERNPEPSNAAGPATAPLETAPAPQGARLESAPAEPSAVAAALDAAAEPLRVPATLEPPAPRASSGRPAQATLPVPAPTPRSFLFGGVGGVVPTCCAAARETPEQDVSLPAPPREAVLPAPGPDREPRIETLEGPDAGQIPASSVWTRLDPEPQIVDPDAPRSRSVVPAPSAVAWLWSLVSALLQPLAEIWTAWRA